MKPHSAWENPGHEINKMYGNGNGLYPGLEDRTENNNKESLAKTVYNNILETFLGGADVSRKKTKTGMVKSKFHKTPIKPTKPTLGKTQHTDFCDETKKYELKKNLITINNKKYIYRTGNKVLAFVIIHKNEFTVVNIYKKKEREHISTRRFGGKLYRTRVKELIFDNSMHVADARKKEERPFRTLHRQRVMPLEDFKKEFKPNIGKMKKSYTSTAKDTAMTSLNEILKEAGHLRLRSGTYSAAINNAMKSIAFGANSYKGTYPAVNVYAIWSNFDPETRLISIKEFNIGEPVLYEYRVLKSKPGYRPILRKKPKAK